MPQPYELLPSHSHRWPEDDGMQRIGYDADTQIYTFRDDGDGTLWESEPGSRIGRLRPKGSGLRGLTGEEEEKLRQAKREDWRYMAPFFLLVTMVLLVVWRFFFGPDVFFHSAFSCPDGTEIYRVVKGDTCCDIAEREGCSAEELRRLNAGLECERLRLGMGVCVPGSRGGG